MLTVTQTWRNMYNVINDRNFYFEECLSALPGPHLAVVFIKEVLIRGCLGNCNQGLFLVPSIYTGSEGVLTVGRF